MTSDFANGMQDDINFYVTRDRLNNANARQKLNPIAKNIFDRQNPLELVFKEISTFDVQNAIGSLDPVCSLLHALDIGKKDVAVTLIKMYQILLISIYKAD